DRLRPACLLLQQLGSAPRSSIATAEHHVDARHQLGQASRRASEALLAFGSQRTIAVVGPLRLVGVKRHGVAHEVQVHTDTTTRLCLVEHVESDSAIELPAYDGLLASTVNCRRAHCKQTR